MNYSDYGLDRTVRVGITHTPEWGGVGSPTGIERGIDVPHAAANIPCGAVIGSAAVWGGDENVPLRCKKRVGHETPKGEKRHKAADFRIVAAPGRVVHAARYAPNAIPRGVDQSTTVPHNCDNHLADTTEVLLRGW